MKLLPLSQRIQSIQNSPTLAVAGKARLLTESGKDVVSFGAGEPDFDTPQNIKDAAIRAIARGDTKYTPVSGTTELKKAIQTKLKRDQNLDFGLQEISTACGGKHALYNIFQVLLNPGDEVVIPTPYWVSYPDQVILAGGRPIFVQTQEADDFCMTAEAFQNAITAKTKAVVITSPNNPTGAVYNRAQLQAIAEVCLQKNIFIISDEIYEKIYYGGDSLFSPAQLSPEIKNITFVVNGASKAYAMTGWRLGFTAGPDWLIQAIDKLQSQSTSNICSITQAAGVEAFAGTQTEIPKMVAAFKKRRDFLVGALNQIPGIRCRLPQGAFYVFPNIKALLGRKTPSGKVLETCTDFCNYLLDDALVATVAGHGFGGPGHMRLSYATSDAIIADGVKRIAAAVRALS